MVCKRFVEPDGKPAIRKAICQAVGFNADAQDFAQITPTEFPVLRRIRTRLNFMHETLRLLTEIVESLNRALEILENRANRSTDVASSRSVKQSSTDKNQTKGKFFKTDSTRGDEVTSNEYGKMVNSVLW